MLTGTTGNGSLPCAPSISVVPSTSPAPTMMPLVSPAGAASASAAIKSITTQESSNWAGYVINQTVPNKASITTNWTATQIDCSAGDGHASSWPGMGGWSQNDPNIAQLGTAEVCTSGSSTYYGWTEHFPDPVAPLDSSHPVKIGDQFSGTITYQGNGQFATTMANKTEGWTETMPMSFSSYTPSTSEIITESSSEYPIVPKFVAISYPGSIYSPDGTTKTPLGSVQKLIRITNDTQSGLLRTDTSPITGETFTTTWTHN